MRGRKYTLKTLPSDFVVEEVLLNEPEKEGKGEYGWYRGTITVPRKLAGKDFILALGKVDDCDEAWFNGVPVGSTGSFPPDYESAWTQPRFYRVPAALVRKDGNNVVAVRVFNGGGPGGIREAATLFSGSGPFDPSAAGARSTGFTVGGTGWYRKTFTLSEAGAGKRVRIHFDGVYMECEVWLNGRKAGEHHYGYTPFWLDLTPHAVFGASNTLAVKVRNVGRNSRWYSGSGIYRHVSLTVSETVCMGPWGVWVTTPAATPGRAVARVRTRVENHRESVVPVTLRTTVFEPGGREIALTESRKRLGKRAEQEFDQSVELQCPVTPWSLETPVLYTAVTEVLADGKVADRVETRFGIRSIAFNARDGFLLNGKPLKLKGACMHHDNGCMGAAAFDAAEYRRVALMKRNGYNAVRTAHNPPSSAFLDACDRLGMLVIDEAFDMWEAGKNARDYHLWFKSWWQNDVVCMMLRDRNHPSVIMWSTGNEIPERDTPNGMRILREIAGLMRRTDPERPVTQAVNGVDKWEKLDPYFSLLDVCGYNYNQWAYVPDHKRVPRRVMYASESFPMQAFDAWMAVKDNPWVIGDFVWTGYDYLGEAAIGWWSFNKEPADLYPWTVAYCGDLDLCGFKRPQSYYRDILWRTGTRLSAFVHAPEPTFGKRNWVGWGWDDVHASWNWPGMEGKPLKVDVYSACKRVRLSLNGRDLGEKMVMRETKYTASWEVPFEPGILKATGYDGDRATEEWTLKTAGKPARLVLVSDREALSADGADLAFVTVEAGDSNGVRHPAAANLVRFRLEGPVVLAGVGNGNPRSVESFQRPERSLFEGRCLAVLRAGRQAGSATLWAESKGLAGAKVVVDLR